MIKKLIDYIITHQNKDGSFSSVKDEDAYSQYHATMTCCQGLTHHKYRGFGPGIVTILPLIKDQIERDTLRIKEKYEIYYHDDDREVAYDDRYDEIRNLFGVKMNINIKDMNEVENEINLEKEEIRKAKMLSRNKNKKEIQKKKKIEEKRDDNNEEKDDDSENNENNEKEKRKLNDDENNEIDSEDEIIFLPV